VASPAATTPQRGILKDGAMALMKEEQKKSVRFSLEGRSPVDETIDHTDSSSNEDDIAVEMEADSDKVAETDDSGEIKGSNRVLLCHSIITDALDIEDSIDSSEQSDDGYIETDSSSEEEMEGESEEGEGATTPLLAAASVNDGASHTHTYVPPHLRDGRTSQKQERLRKTVQGLINR
jgi:hypothetical protein